MFGYHPEKYYIAEFGVIEANVLYQLFKENGSFSVALFRLNSDMFKRAILNFK